MTWFSRFEAREGWQQRSTRWPMMFWEITQGLDLVREVGRWRAIEGTFSGDHSAYLAVDAVIPEHLKLAGKIGCEVTGPNRPGQIEWEVGRSLLHGEPAWRDRTPNGGSCWRDLIMPPTSAAHAVDDCRRPSGDGTDCYNSVSSTRDVADSIASNANFLAFRRRRKHSPIGWPVFEVTIRQ